MSNYPNMIHQIYMITTSPKDEVIKLPSSLAYQSDDTFTNYDVSLFSKTHGNVLEELSQWFDLTYGERNIALEYNFGIKNKMLRSSHLFYLQGTPALLTLDQLIHVIEPDQTYYLKPQYTLRRSGKQILHGLAFKIPNTIEDNWLSTKPKELCELAIRVMHRAYLPLETSLHITQDEFTKQYAQQNYSYLAELLYDLPDPYTHITGHCALLSWWLKGNSFFYGYVHTVTDNYLFFNLNNKEMSDFDRTQIEYTIHTLLTDAGLSHPNVKLERIKPIRVRLADQ